MSKSVIAIMRITGAICALAALGFVGGVSAGASLLYMIPACLCMLCAFALIK
jgi:hypothetical protein